MKQLFTKAKKVLLDKFILVKILCLTVFTLICNYIVVPIIGIGYTTAILDVGAEIIFFLITFIFFYFMGYHYRYLTQNLTKKFYIAIGVLNGYMTFALSASNLFFSSGFSLGAAIQFLMVFVWCLPISLGVLVQGHKLFTKTQTVSPVSKKGSYLVFGISFLTFCLVFGFMLFVFYPGFSSFDTLNQFNQALGITPLSNWHTPFHTLSIRFLLNILNTPAFVVVSQIIFFALIFSSGLRYLYLMGVNRAVLYLFLVVFVLSPNSLVMLITIWKDIPYAACLLWLTILVCKTIKSSELYSLVYRKYIFYLELFLCLVSITLLRQNGFVVALMSGLILLLFSIQKRALSVSCIAAAVFVFFFNGPFMTWMNIENTSVDGGKFIGLGQDITGVYVYGGTLSPKAEYIAITLLGEDADYVYRPSRAYGDSSLDVSTAEFVIEYLHTFINNPAKMTQVILERNWLIWELTTTPDAYIGGRAYMGNMDEYNTSSMPQYASWLEISPARTNLFPAADAFIERGVESISVQAPFLWVFWRCGIYTLLMVASVILLFYLNKKRNILVFVPILSQMLSLVLSTGWADYRYYWAIGACVLFGILFLFAINTVPELNKRHFSKMEESELPCKKTGNI